MAREQQRGKREWGAVSTALFLIFTLGGLALAGYLILGGGVHYRSQAKLMVRYVLERSAIDSFESIRGTDQEREQIMRTEVEILTSHDLARKAAEQLGVEKVLAAEGAGTGGSGDENMQAAVEVIRSSLQVEIKPESNVIALSYVSRDATFPATALQEMINRYLVMHLEIHRALGQFDFLTQQIDLQRVNFHRAEAELREKSAQQSPDPFELEALTRHRDQIRARLDVYEASLEKARVDEALDPTRMPNIAIVQRPTVPVRYRSESRFLLAAASAGGGVLLGIVLGFLARARVAG